MPRSPGAWRRPSGPNFLSPVVARPAGLRSRPATFRAECPPISLPQAGLDRITTASGARGRPNLAEGTGYIRPWFVAWHDAGLERRRRVSRGLRRLLLVALRARRLQHVRQGRAVLDEPADKLYNEGLYLLNNKKDPKTAAKKFEEVDRQHPYSEWARKSLIMTAFAYYEAGAYDECIKSARRYVSLASGQPGCRLCAVPDRLVPFRPDPRNLARPGSHREGGADPRGGGSEISQLRICRRRQARRSRSRAISSPARRWMSGAGTCNGATTPARSTASRSW